MKITSLKVLSLTLAVTFVATQMMCIAGAHAQDRGMSEVYTSTIDPKREYVVEFVEGRTFNVKGSDIELRGELVGIRFQGEDQYKYYSRQQIAEISNKKFSRGAMAIGGVVGAVVGGGLASGLFLALHDVGPGDPSCTSDPGDCAGMAHIGGGIGLGIVGALVGGGAGVGIGAAVSSKKTLIVSPQVSLDGNRGTYGGVSVGMKF